MGAWNRFRMQRQLASARKRHQAVVNTMGQLRKWIEELKEHKEGIIAKQNYWRNHPDEKKRLVKLRDLRGHLTFKSRDLRSVKENLNSYETALHRIEQEIHELEKDTKS